MTSDDRPLVLGAADGMGSLPACEPEDAAGLPSPGEGAGLPGRPGAPGRRRRHGESRTGWLGHWRWLLVGFGLGVVLLAGVAAWAVSWYEHAASPGHEGRSMVVDVASGESVDQVAAGLAKDGIITSTLAFRLYLVLHGTPIVQPGEYLVHVRQPFATLRRRLGQGPDVYALDIPPGFTVAEAARRVGEIPGLDESVFLALATSGSVQSPFDPPGSKSLEGLLAAGTYQILPGETDKTLLDQMVDRFDAEAATLKIGPGAAALGVTPYQAVTIASIVQKEGVYPPNLARVARVIYNRLARGMPLQMDSTVLYSLGQDGGPVPASDRSIPSPYNTYLHAGLTPTPICFPSRASIEAALHPAVGSWLYFEVVSANGLEAFSDTFSGQLANEALARSRGLG
ncbi:MAG: endolytic transglycosylase MltG [Acidimicrobiales bacterium]